MISYASIDRIEEKYVVLELELIEKEKSKTTDFRSKETIMVNFLLEEIIKKVGAVTEGDILVVEHENEKIVEIHEIDSEEKQRRKKLLNEIFNKR